MNSRQIQAFMLETAAIADVVIVDYHKGRAWWSGELTQSNRFMVVGSIVLIGIAVAE